MCDPDLKMQKILQEQLEPVTIEREKQLQQQVQKLLNIPLPEQRTPEWFKMREDFVTASDWGKVLGVGKSNSTKIYYFK